MRADQPAFRVAYWFNGFALSTLAAVCRNSGHGKGPWRQIAARVCAARVDAGRPLTPAELATLADRSNGAVVDVRDALLHGLVEYYARQIATALADRQAPFQISRGEVVNDVGRFARGEALELATAHPARMKPAIDRLAALGVNIDFFGPPWPTENLLNGGVHGTRS